MTEVKVLSYCRPPELDDASFVLSSWVKGYSASDFGRKVAKDLYYPGQIALVKHLLSQSKTIVSCNPEEPDQIFGFVTYYPDYIDQQYVVHYIYVKKPYRKLGIATTLMEAIKRQEHRLIEDKARIFFTHYMPDICYLMRKFDMHYNPYILWKGTYETESLSVERQHSTARQ